MGELTFESAAYVARYCLKKVTGLAAEDHYMQMDEYGVCSWVEPEYATMSRGGRDGRGIAAEWFDKYVSDVFPRDEVPVPGSGVFKKVPRYYEELFKIEDPLTLEEIKKVRQEFKLAHADEYTPERLMAKYKVAKARKDMLIRSL